ncbi:hypothetical protein ACIQ9Q_29400 [Streptomyces sp. NPDC094438]|uniref:hypothetical protein n=1 Tax=Streptomyces sp. NPDC094438 TaxID=3366061 RepID=UPI00382F601A
MAPPRQLFWNGLHVPYIAPWSREEPLPRTVLRIRGRGGEGIGFADELSAADRRHGVLWMRYSLARGAGRPDLAGVHPLRQRQAMSHMLCQVCGKSTYDDPAYERWGERHLVLMRAADGRPISEGERTATPPVCEPCAVESVRACPHLRKGYTAALVKRAQPWGVAGVLYHPETLKPILPKPKDSKDGLTEVSFDQPSIRWVLAARDVATLHGCTTVDLERLAAQGVAA